MRAEFKSSRAARQLTSQENSFLSPYILCLKFTSPAMTQVLQTRAFAPDSLGIRTIAIFDQEKCTS
jgi:hypothetical protein